MAQNLKHQWSIGNNYMTGVTFGKWMKVFAQNRFHISPAYLHRAAFITAASLANSGFAAIESLRFGRAIKDVEITKPPVFILGHWRSGTTLLHDLLAQDTAQFQFANTYQVANPLTFLTTENLFTRLFSGLINETRPMDNMELKFKSPQEDEFALLLLSAVSVYLGMSFPRSAAKYEKYLTFKEVSEKEQKQWTDAFMFFCRKLSLKDDRSLLLKSPPHTARISLILKMFPNAKFVHIHRDPHRVFRSTCHYFDTAGWYTYLQRPNLDVITQEILQRYVTMYDAYFEDADLISKGNFCELRFDQLEADPMAQIESVYDQLSLNGFDTFKPDLQKYVDSLAGYQKNSFSPADEKTREMVATRWSRSFDTWGYDKG